MATRPHYTRLPLDHTLCPHCPSATHSATLPLDSTTLCYTATRPHYATLPLDHTLCYDASLPFDHTLCYAATRPHTLLHCHSTTHSTTLTRPHSAIYTAIRPPLREFICKCNPYNTNHIEFLHIKMTEVKWHLSPIVVYTA
jgi:hypothetical protein